MQEIDSFPVRDIWDLDTRWVGRRVIVYARTDSTNTRALAHVGLPDSAGLAFLADEQTAGRGQHGRTWTAVPRSSVLLSALVHPPGDLARPVIVTAWAAVAVCQIVEQFTGVAPRIKWPNDVLLDGKKICGILSEQSRQGGNAATVVGIGLNVAQTESEFLQAGLPLATSLTAAGASPLSTDTLARQLLRQLDIWYDRLLAGDLAHLEGCWRQYLGQLGHDVVLECTPGSYPGRLVGLGFQALTLEQPGQPALIVPPESVLHIHVPPR